MAAAALTQMLGGTTLEIINAAALALKNILGLTCDPVCGLVEVPCIKRNAFLAIHAVTASELALCGVESKIPVDEVIEAMDKVGRNLPASLRETGIGGLASTPTGEAIKIVEAGVHNMECEVRWYQVHRICDSIEKLNDTLETIATSISC